MTEVAHTPRVFSGIKPSGGLTLGNYLGAIKRFVATQGQGMETIYCVVDLHAITVWQDPADLTNATREVAAGYLASGLDPAKEHAFTVELRDSDLTVEVPADRTLYDVLKSTGIDIPMECGEGLCGTCEARVIEGEVDHRDRVLTKAERTRGERIMTCCSRARGGKLVLGL